MGYKLGSIGSAFDPGTFFLPGGDAPISLPTSLITDNAQSFFTNTGGALDSVLNTVDKASTIALKGAGTYATVKNVISGKQPVGNTTPPSQPYNAASVVPGVDFANDKIFGLTYMQLAVIGVGLMILTSKGRR